MKSFAFSTFIFGFMLFGIIFYQFALEKKSNEINLIADKIEESVSANMKEDSRKQIDALSEKFSEVKEWIMAFEDHEQISLMAQCVESMKANCEYYDNNGLLTELLKFRYLLNYSVESVKPTINNIL